MTHTNNKGFEWPAMPWKVWAAVVVGGLLVGGRVELLGQQVRQNSVHLRRLTNIEQSIETMQKELHMLRRTMEEVE